MTVREPSAPSSDESAVNWPEAPAYSYHGLNAPWGPGAMVMTFALLFLAVAGYMAAYSVTVPDDRGRVVFESTGVAAFGVFLMIVGIFAAWGFPRLHPAIALSPDGVFAYDPHSGAGNASLSSALWPRARADLPASLLGRRPGRLCR
jgi:hypothetical protein